MTVGFGFSPNLLTSRTGFKKFNTSSTEALAGFSIRYYRRWGFSPRPENSQ
jgi:hypothetical protein